MAVLYWLAIQHKDVSYFAAVVDKQHRAETIAGPRLLLAGGSGTAFGFNSQLLEDSLHVPVINLAVHADLGLPYMLRQVEKIAHSGDMVLLTPEYFLGAGDMYTQFCVAESDASTTQFMLFKGPKHQTVSWVNYFLKRIQNSLLLEIDDERGAIIADTTSIFFRAAFSPQGDLMSPLNNRRLTHIPALDLQARDYTKEIGWINATIAALQKRHIKMLVTYPAFAESQFLSSRKAIVWYEAQLQHVPASNRIGIPALFVYPDSLFFDSAYHLHGPGRQHRTQQVVALLKNKMIQPIMLASAK